MFLEAKALTKKFGEFLAVDRLSFTVEEGMLKSIIGPNGAGKTTLFNMLSGGITPSDGTVSFRGDDVTGLPPYELNERGISRSFQITNIFPGVTVRQNIQVAAQCHLLDRPWNFFSRADQFDAVEARYERILERIGLERQADRRAGDLAHGDQRRLEIGIALATDPDLLLLDEPTAGMSPEETTNTIELIQDLSGDHSVLLIEHDMDVVKEVSDEILVLNDGQKLVEGAPADVMADRGVQEAYLGVG